MAQVSRRYVGNSRARKKLYILVELPPRNEKPVDEYWLRVARTLKAVPTNLFNGKVPFHCMASEAPDPKRRKTANDKNEKRQRDGEDNHEEPERKERHVAKGIRQCGCFCETGTIELGPVASSLKCRCTMCGPIGDNGVRRCQITLSMVGAIISLERDGLLICFECRGHE